jgi:hypothetical protein
MKNPHKLICNFYISKNKVRFWVGDNMHSRQLSISRQEDMQSYIYLAVISKLIQNTLQK